ncbi:MAG: SDR family oxidoreductase, partial [Pseudomonadota bacterium]
MTYFVTGATGFIGRRLVKELLQKRGTVYFLVRKKDPKVLSKLYDYWGVDKKRAIAVKGDLSKRRLGVAKKDLEAMRGKVRHMFHLAAIYDITASAEVQEQINVEGTRQAVLLAGDLKAKCFHHVSSIAAAGLYSGVFREDMFTEATGLSKSPYHRTKHESEGVVRHECPVPWRVYGPSILSISPVRESPTTMPGRY